MGLSQREQTKHNTLRRLGTQWVIIKNKSIFSVTDIFQEDQTSVWVSVFRGFVQ